MLDLDGNADCGTGSNQGLKPLSPDPPHQHEGPTLDTVTEYVGVTLESKQRASSAAHSSGESGM